MRRLKLFLQIVLLVGFPFSTTIFAAAPDQGFVEKIIGENRYFIEFANTAVSNFGSPENEKSLKEANQHNFNANLYYLESNYVDAFKEIRLSQEILLDLYYDILRKRYIEDARALLDLNAPVIIQSKDKKSAHFLQLGYRDVEVSRQFRDMGYNYNRFLFSNKIRYYIDGIKRARRAKRFAFLALIESKTPIEDKAEYQTQTWDEARNKDDREKIRDYERVKNSMVNQMNRKLYTDGMNFFLHHDDNYGLISGQKKSILKDAFKELSTKRPEKKKRNPEYPAADQPEEKTPNAPTNENKPTKP
ncbi:MAG TPA: hypothetical protein PLY93_10675 [Turneriella sp.]|nr:hypothetical protein [Turneriella sp.]